MAGHLSPDQLDMLDTAKHLEVYTTIGPAGEPLRAMARSLIMAGHATRIIVAHSMEDSITTLRRFRNMFLAFGAIGTLLMAWLGWAISRRAVIPLRNFSEKINQISERIRSGSASRTAAAASVRVRSTRFFSASIAAAAPGTRKGRVSAFSW